MNLRIIKSMKETINYSKSNKTITNSGWLIGDKIITMVIGVFVTAIIARHFGAEKFGQFNFALSFVSLFTAFSTLGFETINVKSIVQKDEKEGTILATSFVFRILGGVLLLIFATVSFRIFQPNDDITLTIVLILSIAMIFRSFEVIEYWIQAHQNAKLSSLVRLISYVLISIIKIVLVMLDGNIVHYSLIYALDVLIIGLGLVFVYNKYKSETGWSINFSYGFKILSNSWYLILSGLMITIYMQVDKVMLGTMISSKSEVGVYSAATAVASMWYFIPMAIITSFKPIILSQKNSGNLKYMNSVQLLYSIVAFLGVFFGIFILFFSSTIISLLYGSEFAEASTILSISVWAGTFAILGSARSIWLISEGLQKYSLVYTFVGFITNITLNLLLIPKMGGIGAAIATLVSQIITNVFVLMFFKPTKISSLMIIKAFDFRLLKKLLSSKFR